VGNKRNGALGKAQDGFGNSSIAGKIAGAQAAVNRRPPDPVTANRSGIQPAPSQREFSAIVPKGKDVALCSRAA